MQDGRAVEWQPGPNMDLAVPESEPGLVVSRSKLLFRLFLLVVAAGIVVVVVVVFVS